MKGQKGKANYSLILTVQKKGGIDYATILGGAKKYKRSSVRFEDAGQELRITVEAGDATALRASANAILRDLQVIEGATAVPE